jgi:hypothetical protein
MVELLFILRRQKDTLTASDSFSKVAAFLPSQQTGNANTGLVHKTTFFDF